jgi:hypothetical protein
MPLGKPSRTAEVLGKDDGNEWKNRQTMNIMHKAVKIQTAVLVMVCHSPLLLSTLRYSLPPPAECWEMIDLGQIHFWELHLARETFNPKSYPMGQFALGQDQL